jgi:carbohydrate-selective porin OprB
MIASTGTMDDVAAKGRAEPGQGWRTALRQLNCAAVALATSLAVNGAHAEDPAAKTSKEPTAAAAPVPWLLGDWGGYRTRLQQDGIDLQLGYTAEIAANTQGGTDRKATSTSGHSGPPSISIACWTSYGQ